MKLFDASLENTDPKYRIVRDDPRYQDLKKYIEKLWTKFHPFADNSFQADIAWQFHPHFWEMYLGCALLELGFDLTPRETKDGPDLKAKFRGKTVWVEATAPDKGSGDDAVPEPIIDQITEVPEEKVLLRFTNSVYEKKIKLQEYILKGIVKPDEIYIVAINGFLVPYSSPRDEIHSIVKAVLPIGKESITFNLDTFEFINSSYQYRSEIEKHSGSQVPTTAFQNRDFAGISGIIYSNAELWNLPYSFGSDFLFVHNPLATNKIDHGWLKIGKYYWVEDDILRWETME